MKKLIAALIAALSSSQAKAAVLSGAAAASAATINHADPWPWLVSALGALVVIAKFPSVSRWQGGINAMVSVMVGGLGSGFANDYLAKRLNVEPGQLLMAFAMSALWPAVVSMVQQLWPALRKRAERQIEGGQ